MNLPSASLPASLEEPREAASGHLSGCLQAGFLSGMGFGGSLKALSNLVILRLWFQTQNRARVVSFPPTVVLLEKVEESRGC